MKDNFTLQKLLMFERFEAFMHTRTNSCTNKHAHTPYIYAHILKVVQHAAMHTPKKDVHVLVYTHIRIHAYTYVHTCITHIYAYMHHTFTP